MPAPEPEEVDGPDGAGAGLPPGDAEFEAGGPEAAGAAEEAVPSFAEPPDAGPAAGGDALDDEVPALSEGG